MKTRDTLIDKLRRQPTIRLTTIQDIAGARVVCGMTREEQDAVVARLVDEFPEARVVDRRVTPTFGYRAVHVIPRLGGCNVEIQVRTGLQNVWAQRMEGVADHLGRGIRYGEDPEDPDALLTPNAPITNAQLVRLLRHMSDLVDAHERDAIAAEAVHRIVGEFFPSAGLADEPTLVRTQQLLLNLAIEAAEAGLAPRSDTPADGPDGRENR